MQSEGDGLVTWADLGPLQIRAIDEDGQRFPCGCHVEPAALIILAPTLADGRLPYVSVPLSHPRATWPHVFENALNSLAEFIEQEAS